jgi:ribosomal protein S18 acetylase RimI-like enzyme
MIAEVDLTSKNTQGPLDQSGFTIRNWRGEADYGAMARILGASRNADGLEEARTADDLQKMYERMKNFDVTQDLFLAELDAEPVAYAGCRWWQERDGDFIHAHWVFVLPQYRGRGIEEALLARAQGRLRECAREHATGGVNWFEMFSHDSQGWISDKLIADGYSPVRYFYDMVCATLDNLPEAELPLGIETKPAIPEHFRQIWDAEGEAFSEHWGEAVEDESDFERFLKNPIWKPELWQVAWEGDQVVGMVLNYINENENAKYNYRRGYTENISVRKPWRGRGIARALLVKSMKMFREMGFDHTALGVDTENATGALKLYTGVGYRTVRTEVIYRKRM